MNFQNSEPIFKTGTEIFMNFKNNETVFITGKGMKIKSILTAGFICIALGIVLSIVFGYIFRSTFVLGLIMCGGGIARIVLYFSYQKMTISVSNLRITGRCIRHNFIDIPIGQVNAVEIQKNGFLKVSYIENSGEQKYAVFPKMENAEQIYNTIYSLVFAPPVSQQGQR